jgi:hypothetical protein
MTLTKAMIVADGYNWLWRLETHQIWECKDTKNSRQDNGQKQLKPLFFNVFGTKLLTLPIAIGKGPCFVKHGRREVNTLILSQKLDFLKY